MSSRNPWIGVIIALAAVLCTPSVAAQGVAGERDLKAAIIYKLAKFVQRPEGRPPDCYTIGVLGDVELAKALEKTVKNRTVAGAKVVVQRFEEPPKASACDVVFLPAANEEQRDRAIELQSEGVLVVSDLEGFAKRGGIVEMKRVRSRIRFVVNPDAAKAANLELSSTLLRLADVVRGGVAKTSTPPSKTGESGSKSESTKKDEVEGVNERAKR